MPLFDHFHAPVEFDLPWEVLHGAWSPAIAKLLNERWLPREFIAFGHAHIGPQFEIDVATLERTSPPGGSSTNGGGIALLPRTWTPPVAQASMPAVFPDSFEVRVVTTSRGRRLVAAIELVSPANKDRPAERQAFVAKCASYLQQGVSVVIMDVVADRHANLHNELLRWFNGPDAVLLPASNRLYTAAYRPVLRDAQAEIDIWVEPCSLAAPLPTMPLHLPGELCVPIEFETTYCEVCRAYRLS